METLPAEVLIYILEFFDMKTREPLVYVNKRWRNIILNTPKLNSHFTMTDLSDVSFLKHWERSTDIKTLVIETPVDLIYTLIEEIKDVCPNLKSITISKSNLLCERHVHRLSKCFPLLESIDIFLTSFYIPTWFLDILDNMKVIVLNNRLDDTALRVIAERCTKLKELHMYGYVKFYPICHLQNLLMLRCQTLTKLTLRCCEFNDKTCVYLGNCANLVKLYMYHCWLITDKGLSYLSSFKHLKTLHMTGLKLVTKTALENFLKKLKMDAITELNFSASAFSDKHALILCQKSMFLETLELWNCPFLTSKGIDYILDKFPDLRVLDLSQELTHATFFRILYSKVTFLRFDTIGWDVVMIWKMMQDRKMNIEGVSLCSNELCYRGSMEGYRANYMCYISQSK